MQDIAYNAGDPGSIPHSGRSPGEGNGCPLQYSCLENSIDRGAWWAAVHGVAQSRTRLRWLSSSSSSTLRARGDVFNYMVGESGRASQVAQW